MQKYIKPLILDELALLCRDAICHYNGFWDMVAYVVGSDEAVDAGMHKCLADSRTYSGKHDVYALALRRFD